MRTFIKIITTVAAIALPAAHASAERIFGLGTGNTIVTFDTTAPGATTTSGTIAGLGGAVLTGIDQRPADRKLYSLATNGTLYRIDKDSSGSDYTAVAIASLTNGANGNPVNVSGARFGLDFNPTVDRLRFVTDNDQNLRINPGNGVTTVDGSIDEPGAEAFTGAAYTNSRPGALTTRLFALDASGNQLLSTISPNTGAYTVIGTLSGNVDLGAANNVGFDISGGTGAAFFNVGNQLFSLNLANAATTSLGTIGAGSLIGITAGAVPEPATWAMMILGFGLVGAAMRRRSVKTTVSFA